MEQLKTQLNGILDIMSIQYRKNSKLGRKKKALILKAKAQMINDTLMLIDEIEKLK